MERLKNGIIHEYSDKFLLTFLHKAFIILLISHYCKGSDEEEYIGFRKPREKMVGVNLREEGMEVASELRS